MSTGGGSGWHTRGLALAPGQVRERLVAVAGVGLERRVKPPAKQAGVAIILAGSPRRSALCFLRRVERAGDRWSGDVAFPGGWAHPDDGHLTTTARREAREEVGLDLDAAAHLGDLPVKPITGGTRGRLGTIGASVFHIGPAQAPLARCTREVAAAFWVPVPHLLDPRNRTQVDYAGGALPGIRFGSHVIWGLTYRILDEFLALMRAD